MRERTPHTGTADQRGSVRHLVVVIGVLTGLFAAIGSTPAAQATPDPARSGDAPVVAASESELPALPLPDCQTAGINPTDDTKDCEGTAITYPADANVPRPAAGALALSASTRTLDIRKESDRPTTQIVTFSWAGGAPLSATVGTTQYVTKTKYLWPDYLIGGNWGDHYLKRRTINTQWASNVEGAPYGTSENPDRPLFVRVGSCFTGPPTLAYSDSATCSYKVTWGDYGDTRVLQAMIFRLGLKANFSWSTKSTSTGNWTCGNDIDTACGSVQGSSFTTFRTDPPPPLKAYADSRRTGPGQFVFDATRSGPDIVSYRWSSVSPTFQTTAPTFDWNFDDYKSTVGEYFTGGYMDLQVKDKWNRTAFASSEFSILKQVGTQGPLKIKSQTVTSVENGVVTISVVVENTTDSTAYRVGLISKRNPGATNVGTSPNSATIAGKATATFTIKVPVDQVTDYDIVSEGFGLSSTSTNLRTGTVTTHVTTGPAVGPTCKAGTPVATAATATTVTVSTPRGACPVSGAGAPTGYHLLTYAGSSTTASKTQDLAGGATSATVTGLTAGTRYRFRLVAFDADGSGPEGTLSAFALPPFATLDSFTNRQYLDFENRAATTAEKSSWSAKLGNATLSPTAAISSAEDLPYWSKQAPVIRLFRAYFGRLPDLGGLRYWADKSRSGTSINVISSSFAASREFQTKYGNLSNQAFVELVYTNVLGRPGDPGGIASWTNKLNAKTKTRGQVMVGFSESGEYKRKAQPVVDIVNSYTGMLRRVPSKAESDLWEPQLTAGTPRTTLIASLLASAAYDARTP